MEAFFQTYDKDITEPFASGPLDYILDRAEAMHPGIEFNPSGLDSEEAFDGILFSADVPNGSGEIIIVDRSFRV